MDHVVLLALVAGSFGVAFTTAKGALAVIFYVMVHRRFPVTIHWRPLLFVVALFWFWYLAPASAQTARFLLTP